MATVARRRMHVLEDQVCAAAGPAARTLLIAGMGPGASMGIVQRFVADGYRVAMLARDGAKLAEYEAQIPGSKGYSVDLSDESAVTATVKRVHEDFAVEALDAVVYNASTGAFVNVLDTDCVSLMKRNMGNNMYGLLFVARATAPGMLARGSGSIIVTGNTSSKRGLAQTSAFAPTKAAQRILTESMARYLGPKGVHVGYVLIDAAIDMPFGRAAVAKALKVPVSETPDEIFCTPAGIGDAVFTLAHQNKQAWTFEMDVRPFGEKW